MEIKHLNLQSTELKLLGDDMTFAGYASVFGGIDAYGDTIDPKAYDATLEERERPIRMRWNHFGPVIGKWLELRTDDRGLWVHGQLTPGHSVAMDVYASMKHGAIDGMSIGYIPEKSEQLPDGRRLLRQIKLIEISVVEEPADLGARIDNVKNAFTEASSVREIEVALRDSGHFTRSEALALVSRMKTLLRGELAAEERAKAEILATFQKFVSI